MESIIEEDKDADSIDLQALLDRVNFEKRWVYRGSFTSPPCIEGVFWHIIDDVLPINQETLNLFLRKNNHHSRGDHRCDTCTGNNRQIQPLNDRIVYYVHQDSGKNVAENHCR